MRPTILLTGFGPFPGVPVNATSAFVPQLAAAASQRFPWTNVVVDVLTTEWKAASRRLTALLGDHQPSLAVHFGVSADAQGFVIETTACNRTCAKVDAGGALPPSPAVVAGGPDRLVTPLDSSVIAERLVAQGLPVSVSTDAGSYLCNAVLYRSLHHAATRAGDLRALFVHLPASLAGSRAAQAAAECPLSWADAVAGSTEILAVCLEGLETAAANLARSEPVEGTLEVR